MHAMAIPDPAACENSSHLVREKARERLLQSSRFQPLHHHRRRKGHQRSILCDRHARAARGQVRVINADAGVKAAERNLESAQAMLEEAEAKAVKTDADLVRCKALVAKENISRQQYDQAVAEAKANQAAVASASAAAVASGGGPPSKILRLHRFSRFCGYGRLKAGPCIHAHGLPPAGFASGAAVPTTTRSTRRFALRPSGVALSATGRYCP